MLRKIRVSWSWAVSQFGPKEEKSREAGAAVKAIYIFPLNLYFVLPNKSPYSLTTPTTFWRHPPFLRRLISVHSSVRGFHFPLSPLVSLLSSSFRITLTFFFPNSYSLLPPKNGGRLCFVPAILPFTPLWDGSLCYYVIEILLHVFSRGKGYFWTYQRSLR